jgi:hypothetical protein
MSEPTVSPAPTAPPTPKASSAAPVWRTILDGHTAWQELTRDLDVEYRPDGLRIEYVAPETARALMSILYGTMPTAPRGGHRANGELSVGLGG